MNPTEHPITEDDIANFLANTPDFFERHAELLATVQLSSGHGSRAVSLQERQAGMLREKIKGLETRVVDMIRHGTDNEAIAARLQRWTQRMLQVPHANEVPGAMVQGLLDDLLIPQAAIKLWDTSAALASEAFTHGVSQDIRTFTASLSAPYCGINAGFEAVGWLAGGASVQSLALIPLMSVRASADALLPVSGLLILASPDVERFQAGMGVDFLVH
ncbi:MAG: DUF484 family protein, partial [Polaromonas sp.]|nr:DUF484 family protein [Polaromonas sp.]